MSAIIVICAYLPAWSAPKQRSAIFQLIHSIEDAVNDISENGQPLNGADTSPLCNAYKLRQIDALDVIFTKGPACYTANNYQSIGSSVHKVVEAKAPSSDFR